MQRREDLPLDMRRRFLSGRPALDFTHTGGEGEYAVWEIIHNLDDLAHWLGVILEVDSIRTRPADLRAMRALRTAIGSAARNAAAGRPAPQHALETINAVASTPPLIPLLGPDGIRRYAAPTAAAALSTLARDAIDLLSGPLAARIRVCAAADCGLLFVDASRPGKRRWCSMQRCGNLAKVRSYRHRQDGRPAASVTFSRP